MEQYEVEFRPEADEDLSRLPTDERARILERIRWLSTHSEQVALEPLKGKQWRGVFKLRAGDYRILYTVDSRRRLLTVHIVGHRRDIYR